MRLLKVEFPIEELRHDVAVLDGWKRGDEILTVREYVVKNPIKVRSGLIGPQTETNSGFPSFGYIYEGGAHQYEFIDYLGNGNWENFLICPNKNGIILK